MTSSSIPANFALQISIVLFTLGTALIHFSLNFPDPAFILNSLGYLALLAGLYLPFPKLARYRNAVRWTLSGYTALTIFLWILFGERTPFGYTAKIFEVALILLLLVDARRSRSSSP
jgi:membrane-bound ClpP family serine protease